MLALAHMRAYKNYIQDAMCDDGGALKCLSDINKNM